MPVLTSKETEEFEERDRLASRFERLGTLEIFLLVATGYAGGKFTDSIWWTAAWGILTICSMITMYILARHFVAAVYYKNK